jgi:four helix bundle protein
MTEKLPYASRYQDLLAYKKTLALCREVFMISESFPKEELYSLTSQIRRSSRSIGAQIAEAWGKRSYVKHFSSKLTDAISESYETQHWVVIAKNCGYLSSDIADDINTKYLEINRMLSGMIIKADYFCNQ